MTRHSRRATRARAALRALGAFAAAFGITLLIAIPDASAGTVYNPNPPSAGVSCDLAFSTTSSWANGSISVKGTCGGPALPQNLAPAQGSAGCMSGPDPFWCAYDTSEPLTVMAIAAWYWNGTVEINFMAMEATKSPSSTGNGPGNSCGFNSSSIDFNSSGLGSPYGFQRPNVQDPTATAQLQNSLPQAGSYESTPFDPIRACDTGSSAAVWVGVSTSSTNSGSGMAYLQNNGWCNAGYTGNGECNTGAHSGYTISGVTGGLWLDGTFSPTSTWSGGASPCTLYSVTGDGSEPVQQASSSTPYTLSFSSADAIVAVDDAYTTGSPVDVYGKSFVLPGLEDMKAGGNLSSPGIISFQAAVGDVVNPDFWCYSTSGGWVQWGTFGSIQSSGGTCTGSNCGAGGGGPGSPGSGTGGPFSLGSCLDGTGFSWTDPTTWVLGGIKDMGCVLQWLFEPSSSSWQSLQNVFGFTSLGARSGSCSATAPGGVTGSVSQWIGAGFTLVVNGPSCAFGTMQTDEAAGQTSSTLNTAAQFTASDGKTYQISLPAAMNSITSSAPLTPLLATVLLLETAILGLAFFFAIKELIQRLMAA